MIKKNYMGFGPDTGEKVHVGQIWKVHTAFYANPTSFTKKDGERQIKVMIDVGEYIEIRYSYAWHFRTYDNMYMQVDEPTLVGCCDLHGVIWENVRFNNLASLKVILDHRFYDPFSTKE